MTLKPNYFYISFLYFAFLAIALITPIIVICQNFDAIFNNGEFVEGWTTFRIIIFTLTFIAIGLWFSMKLYCSTSSVVTSRSISQKNYFSMIEIPWDKVVSIGHSSTLIKISSKERIINIPIQLFKNPNKTAIQIHDFWKDLTEEK